MAAKFLSTPSARRATFVELAHQGARRLISIHALREEGDPVPGSDDVPHRGISIHALREEGDGRRDHCRQRTVHFYPRPPRGGRPKLTRAEQVARFISIHALREEGDVKSRWVG